MVRSQLNSYSGSDPIWGFVALLGSERFTGEAAVGIDPRLRLFAVDGRVYFAERDGDLPIGTRLVNCGAVTTTQLEQGSVRIGDTDSLARLFQRQPLIDRDAVELTIELATEALLESVADKPVGMPEVFPLRHHPAGIHHWARPATSPSGSVPLAAAPLTLPSSPEPEIDAAVASTPVVVEPEPVRIVAEPEVIEPEVAVAEIPAAEAPVELEPAVFEPAVFEPAVFEPVAFAPLTAVPLAPAVDAEPEFAAPEAGEPETAPEPSFAQRELTADPSSIFDHFTPLTQDTPGELPSTVEFAADDDVFDTVATTPTLQIETLDVATADEAPVFTPLASSNGSHASWQPAESIFARPGDEPEAAPAIAEEPPVADTAAAAAEQPAGNGFEPLAGSNGFGGRTLPSLAPLPPIEEAAEPAVAEVADVAETVTEAAPSEPPRDGFASLPTLGAMTAHTAEPERPDIFAAEAAVEPAEPAPTFSSLSSLQPLQPLVASEPAGVADQEQAAPPAEIPALPTLAAKPSLTSASDFFDSLPEPSMYEPGVLPADLPKLASAPISMDDLVAANAEPAGPWTGATHNLAAVQIWEMVDDILDDGQSREPEMANGGGSEKRGRGWLRGRKG